MKYTIAVVIMMGSVAWSAQIAPVVDIKDDKAEQVRQIVEKKYGYSGGVKDPIASVNAVLENEIRKMISEGQEQMAREEAQTIVEQTVQQKLATDGKFALSAEESKALVK
jgi:hypothetical protein